MIRNLPVSERPRERCLKQGARTLSLRECLAVVLGSGGPAQDCLGLATQILDRPGPGLAEAEQEKAFFLALEGTAETHLCGIKGIGTAHRARLLAAFEIGRRYEIYRNLGRFRDPGLRVRQETPERALRAIPNEMRNEPREWLGFVPVHRSGAIGGFCLVERGLRTHIHVDPAELFARILALRPMALFLFHNHPSGELSPSGPDLHLTREVKRLCESFGIRLLGHGIVSRMEERWIVL